jgi:2-dehydro-3-deoxygalactonokinase
MSNAGDVIASATSDQGMGTLSRPEFEPCLIDMIDPWLGGASTPIITCGMVGSRQGWAEAPYREAPTTPAGDLYEIRCSDPRIKAFVLPGIKQLKHPDVMRGEETQIAGFLSSNTDFDGVLCLPGTHTKWVRISAGEVVSFQTFMTGELFQLLAANSVLRHSIGENGWDKDAFSSAVSDALSNPALLASKLFQLRASDLLEGATPNANRARLSGLLIGVELAASKPYWLGQDIALVGAPELNDLYAEALASQGLSPSKYTGDDMTLKGLITAYQETHT